MELARDIAAWVLVLAGSFFLIVGALGLVRFPDVYARVHSAGLMDTLGAGFFIFGLTLYGGFTLVTVKLLMILAFIFFTSPTSTNALANAIHASGIEPWSRKKEDETSKPS